MCETKKHNTHLPEFKAKVGLEAVRGVKTVNRIAQEFGVHPVHQHHLLTRMNRRSRRTARYNGCGLAPQVILSYPVQLGLAKRPLQLSVINGLAHIPGGIGHGTTFKPLCRPFFESLRIANLGLDPRFFLGRRSPDCDQLFGRRKPLPRFDQGDRPVLANGQRLPAAIERLVISE